MRETGFIKQNKKKWGEFESILRMNKKDPEQLSNLFIEITDDLAYSRTFYPNRSVRVYLNSLAQSVFHNIYKNKKTNRKRFMNFWQNELPQLVYLSRWEFLLSLVLFMLSFSIGILSSYFDPDFVRSILGDSYVNMTIANIERGDPMAVYKSAGEIDMFLGISFNNLLVAFRTFVTGVLFGIGTAIILIYNGIMVGAFQYFFIERGLFIESALTIWLHGTLEISAIIIAGAAGITMGKGLLFPGTYSRIQSFQISARKGIKIMIGITPIFLMAALIEGFLTRYTETPNIIRLILILLSLTFIIGYFVVLPYLMSRKGFKEPLKEERVLRGNEKRINTNIILTNGDIFSEVFTLYRKLIPKIFIIAIISALVCTSIILLSNLDFNSNTELSTMVTHTLTFIFDYRQALWLYPLMTLAMTVVAGYSYYFFKKSIKKGVENVQMDAQSLRIFFTNYFLKTFTVFAFLNLIFFLPEFIAIILFAIGGYIFFLWGYVLFSEKIDIFKAISRTFTLLGASFSKVLGLHVMLLLLGGIFFFFLSSPVIYIYFEFLHMNLPADDTAGDFIYIFLVFLIIILAILLMLPMFVFGNSLQYYSLREIGEAVNLRRRIRLIGQKNMIYGMEKES